MKFILSTFLACFLFSCNESTNTLGMTAYLGGAIDNPKSDYIYLKDSDGKKDTLQLNKENRFFKKLDELKPGLYEIGHGVEYQVLVLEPNDSIGLRLNTSDFDESLAYTGRGSRKNNYLIKLYLEHEKNDFAIRKAWSLEPEIFQVMLDSILNAELDNLNEFNSKKNTSSLFKSISESIVKFNYYYYKEIYPFYHFGPNRLIHFKDLPEDFYAYRKDLDLNNDGLTEHYIYRNYIFSYLNNYSLYDFYKDGNHNLKFNNKSVSYNVEKLRLIDSLFVNEDIKNYLLTSVAKEYILETEDTIKMKKIHDAFANISNNQESKQAMSDYLNARLNVRAGKSIPNVVLLDREGKSTNIKDLIVKPTLIYFWATNHKIHAQKSHSAIRGLEFSYPDIDFIGINVTEFQTEYWQKTLKDYRFNSNNEYLFKNLRNGATALAADLDRVLLVYPDGTFVDTQASLFNNNLEQSLLQLNGKDLAIRKAKLQEK